jgi:hypothetical protein
MDVPHFVPQAEGYFFPVGICTRKDWGAKVGDTWLMNGHPARFSS